MKRFLHIVAALLLAVGFGSAAVAQQAPGVLTSFDFTIVGVGIGVSPDYQDVPKSISSQVNTSWFAPPPCGSSALSC